MADASVAQAGEPEDDAGLRLYNLCHGRREGGAEEAAALVDAGAELNWADGEGRDAACWAAILGNAPMLRMFLDRGLPARHCSEKTGLSLLSYAARNGRWDCCGLLAGRGGIDPESRGPDGQHALHCACEAAVEGQSADGEKAGVIRLLLPWHDPWLVYDEKFRYAAIHGVCQAGGAQSLAALYMPGMEKLRDGFGYTGLMRSAKFGHLDQVAWWVSFLDEEALSMVQNDGKSALDFAIERARDPEKDELVKTLRMALAQSRKRALESCVGSPAAQGRGKHKNI